MLKKIIIATFLICFSVMAEEELPVISLTTLQIPTVKVAEVKIAKLVIPEVKLAVVEIQPIEVERLGLPQVQNEQYAFSIADCGVSSPESSYTSTVSGGGVAIARIPTLNRNIETTKAYYDFLKKINDKLTVQNDKEFYPGSAMYSAWKAVYDEYGVDYIPVHVALPKGIRMIAEIRYQIDSKILERNILFYASKGYNSILITFDGTEPVDELVSVAKQCRKIGLKPWMAYSGREDLSKSVFIEPSTLKRYINLLAAQCDGLFIGWRRTSLHLFAPDKEFKNFIIMNARRANPNICIVGESYFGHTTRSRSVYSVTTDIPTNASGCLIVNIGYSNVVPKVLDTVFGKISVPKLVLVLGNAPYYNKGKAFSNDFNKNFSDKVAIEKKFIAAGAAGTVTLHGDGSDGVFSPLVTDNIAQNSINNTVQSGR